MTIHATAPPALQHHGGRPWLGWNQLPIYLQMYKYMYIYTYIYIYVYICIYI
jgi:hypothetical protein